VPLFDKLHINQVLFNLLSNAVKYTPEGGTITYSDHFSKAGQDGKLSVEFSVSDTGVGISEEFQKEIFKPFRPRGTHRRRPGYRAWALP
jgi:signal transduction histidine kinase